MTTSGVIEHFDVVEDIAAGSLPGSIGFTTDTLTFEQLDAVELIEWCEALGADVNVFFSDLQTMLRQQSAPPLE